MSDVLFDALKAWGRVDRSCKLPGLVWITDSHIAGSRNSWRIASIFSSSSGDSSVPHASRHSSSWARLVTPMDSFWRLPAARSLLGDYLISLGYARLQLDM
jgi:hypothetical protein